MAYARRIPRIFAEHALVVLVACALLCASLLAHADDSRVSDAYQSNLQGVPHVAVASLSDTSAQGNVQKGVVNGLIPDSAQEIAFAKPVSTSPTTNAPTTASPFFPWWPTLRPPTTTSTTAPPSTYVPAPTAPTEKLPEATTETALSCSSDSSQGSAKSNTIFGLSETVFIAIVAGSAVFVIALLAVIVAASCVFCCRKDRHQKIDAPPTISRNTSVASRSCMASKSAGVSKSSRKINSGSRVSEMHALIPTRPGSASKPSSAFGNGSMYSNAKSFSAPHISSITGVPATHSSHRYNPGAYPQYPIQRAQAEQQQSWGAAPLNITAPRMTTNAPLPPGYAAENSTARICESPQNVLNPFTLPGFSNGSPTGPISPDHGGEMRSFESSHGIDGRDLSHLSVEEVYRLRRLQSTDTGETAYGPFVADVHDDDGDDM